MNIVTNLKPSVRNELEITDVNKVYLSRQELNVMTLKRGFAWLDSGTPQSMVSASNFVMTLEERLGFRIFCPEEIAYNMGFISHQDLLNCAEPLKKSTYGQYLHQVAQEKYNTEN